MSSNKLDEIIKEIYTLGYAHNSLGKSEDYKAQVDDINEAAQAILDWAKEEASACVPDGILLRDIQGTKGEKIVRKSKALGHNSCRTTTLKNLSKKFGGKDGE